MSLSEYRFDLTRLWDEPSTQNGYGAVTEPSAHSPRPLTRRTRSAVGTVGVSEYPSENPLPPNVVAFRAASPSEAGLRLALAGVVVGTKNTEMATRRCRKRLGRVLGRLAASPQATGAPPDAAELAEQATRWLASVCGSCGKCAGPWGI